MNQPVDHQFLNCIYQMCIVHQPLQSVKLPVQTLFVFHHTNRALGVGLPKYFPQCFTQIFSFFG